MVCKASEVEYATKSSSLTEYQYSTQPSFGSARLENLFSIFQEFNQQIFIKHLLGVQGKRDRTVNTQTNVPIVMERICWWAGGTVNK